MQFILQARDFIRENRENSPNDDKLSKAYSMNLYTRFFVNSLKGKGEEWLVASEAHLDYSREF